MSDSRSLSSQFLIRLREMHAPAWTRLVHSFSPAVYGWCRQAGLSGHDSADVVQEVFSTDEFESQTWEAFRLTAIENYSASEVAERLAISIASVYQARCRVLRRLKQRPNELPE